MMDTIVINDLPTVNSHNHASNLLQLSNGEIVCAWFSGSREGKADISITFAKYDTETNTWNDPQVLKDNSEKSEQNPVLFEINNELWLIYTAQDSIQQETSIVRQRKSRDYGQTWSPPVTLFEQPGTFIRNPPVLTGDETIILPAYYSMKSENGFLGGDRSVVKISNDAGDTWNEFAVPESEGLVHMTLAQAGENKLAAFFRSRKADYIYTASSLDGGKTWNAPVATSLPNNNASIQSFTLNNGMLALVFNNTNAVENPPKANVPPWFDKEDVKSAGIETKENTEAIWGVIRSPLTLAVSKDYGKTWGQLKTIDHRDKDSEETELSYPSVMQSNDGNIHVTYTYLRKNIRHASFSLDWIYE